MEDHRKVQLAAWLLKEEAAFWWEVTNATRPVETWADFRERFGLKFLSSAEENLQMERFLALKQGDMSVREYVNKFNQLARFGLDLVNTAQKKAVRFARGLNEPLHSLAITHIPMGATFESLVIWLYLMRKTRIARRRLSLMRLRIRKLTSRRGQQE